MSRTGIWAAVVVGLAGLTSSRGDEPNKPTASASEANPAVPAPGHSVHGEAFDDGPRRAATILPGMGKISFAVSTVHPDVPAFINQGVAQLHSFLYMEAERSFRQAAKLDGDCAMAYWGMAMANVNNSKRAKQFLKDARKRDVKVSRREKLYIDALEALYKDGVNDQTRKQNHLLGLETIVQEFPGDIDARAWLAMVTWQNGNITSRQSVDTVIDSVLQVEPMHPGAHHYRIHLWDGVKPARAEKAAMLFGKSAVGIAHAWHMPGHTYTGLKRYADAAYQQEASARVDHAYMMRDHVMPFEIHNYAHNNQWLATSLSHIGRARDAIVVARNLVEQPRDPNKNGKNDGGAPQRSGRSRWSEVLVRYELWDDLIAATASNALDWSDVPVERKEKAYTLGLAYAAKADSAKLGEQIAALKAIQADKKISGNIVDAALAELEGHQILLNKGDVASAFDRFAKATAMRPEALARAHLLARNYGYAESAAKSAADKHPNEVPPLAALVEVLIACGKTKDAQAAYRKLEPLARQADLDTPVFQRLAPVVASWKSEAGWPANGSEDSASETAERVDLKTLGPLAWSPVAAEPFAKSDTHGSIWSLAEHKDKNVVVLFFLGGKCPHCMQQLQAFGKEVEALKKLNTEIVALSTDNLEATKGAQGQQRGRPLPDADASRPRARRLQTLRGV